MYRLQSKSDPVGNPLSHFEGNDMSYRQPPYSSCQCGDCDDDISHKDEEPQLMCHSIKKSSGALPIPCPMPSRRDDVSPDLEQELIERYNCATWKMYWRIKNARMKGKFVPASATSTHPFK